MGKPGTPHKHTVRIQSTILFQFTMVDHKLQSSGALLELLEDLEPSQGRLDLREWKLDRFGVITCKSFESMSREQCAY